MLFIEKNKSKIQSLIKSSSKNKISLSNLRNLDFEINTDYFDIVPDEKILTKNLWPIFNVRFKTKGLITLSKIYKENFNINIQTHGIVIEKNLHSISSDEVKGLFLDENQDLFDFLNLNTIAENETKGIIINFVNKDRKLTHSSPVLINKNNNIVNIILFDNIFYFLGKVDEDCLTIQFGRFIKSKFKDVKIYCSDFKFVKDQNSCSILAFEILKRVISEKNLLKNIIQSAVNFTEDNSFFLIKIPNELHDISQGLSFKEEKNNQYVKNILFRNNSQSYNPFNIKILEEEFYIKKDINLMLHFLGHKFAQEILDKINKEEKEKIIQKYNPSYWMQKINEKEETKLSFSKQIINIRRNIKNVEINSNF